MSDDVKVRFSAEGTDQIIGSMTKIKDEAKKTGKEGKEAFEGFHEAVHELGKELFGFLALAAVIDKTKELFSEIVNGALSLDKLHKTTGMSTDALQALKGAAEETHVSTEQLNKGIEFFSRTMGQAEMGSKKAVNALREVGLSMKDLKGLNADEQFALVSKRLAEIEDPARRAAAGAAIFGKQFLEIQPAIMEVAENGVDPFLKHMKELGVYLDGDAIEQMKAAKKGMHEIGEETKGLATQFLVGFMPAAQEAMDSFVKATAGPEGGVGAMERLGRIVGAVAVTIVQAFQIVGEIIGNYVSASVHGIEILGTAMDDLVHGRFSALKNDMQNGIDNFVNFFGESFNSIKSHGEQAGSVWADAFAGKADINGGAQTGKRATGEFESDDAPSDAYNKAQLAVVQARLEAELALTKVMHKAEMEAEKAAYEQGKESLQKYFDDRAAIIKADGEKEADILRQRIAAVQSSKIEKDDDGSKAEQRKAEIIKLQGQLAVKLAETQNAIAQNENERAAAIQKNIEQQRVAQEKLLQIEGKKAEAARMQLEDETKKLALDLQRAGLPKADVDKTVSEYQRQGSAKIDFEETRRQAQATLGELNAQVKEIQDKVKDGSLFPIQGEQQIIALEKERLPALEETAAKLEKIAKESKDPALLAQADQFKEKINGIKTATDEAGKEMAKLKQHAQDALQNGLAKLMTNLLDGTHSVKDAFREMAAQFLLSIAQMEAQALAAKAVQAFLGGGPGAGGAAGAGVGVIASLFAADGGHIRGAGTGTSDSIPAMLSDGEFVVKSDAVNRPGMLALLHAINGSPGFSPRSTAGPQRYAEGGSVAGGGGVNIKLVNVPDSSLLSDHLDSAAGEQQVINILARNPSRVRQALG